MSFKILGIYFFNIYVIF